MKETELTKVFGSLPIRGPVAFSNKAGKFKERIRRQQLMTLSHIVEELKHQLDHDEEVLFAAKAISPFTMVEQLITGWSLFYSKCCILVLTNHRILHFPVTFRCRGRNMASMIRFQDVAKVKAGRKTVFVYKNGVKEAFYAVKNGKKFRSIIESLRITSSTSSSRGGRHHLCPRCTATLVAESFTCPKCRFKFKSPVLARLISIFLPGGGYFYTRHPIMGFFAAAVELVLAAAIFLFGFGDRLNTQALLAPDALKAGIAAVVLVLEKLLTVYQADKFVQEYIPREKNFQRLPKPAPPAKPKIKESWGELEDEKVTFL